MPLSPSTAEGRIGHYRADEETTLIACLTGPFELSPAAAQQLLSIGAVYANFRRTNKDVLLRPDQYVRVHFKPKRYPAEHIDWTATILHNDDAFVVVNKPAGIPVHATLDNQIENVLHQTGLALGAPLFITQRLDAEVSGLLVLAKTPAFQTLFNRLLKERAVKKRYRALAMSPPEPGRHIHYMEPTKRSPKTVAAEPKPGWLECALRIVEVVPEGEAFKVEIDLETGRTHQIRAQLSAMGSPIVGDTRYGSQARNDRPGIALMSVATSWTGPDGKTWEFRI